MVLKKSLLAIALMLSASALRANILLDRPYGSPDTVLTAGDPTMDDRILRDGVPSDWSYMKFFPGMIGTTGPRAYDTWTFQNVWGIDLYVQITLDDLANTGLVFSSAHLNSFDALNQDTNYIGDAGFSPLVFGLPVTYQVIVPAGNNLVVVVNQTSALAGDLPLEYGLMVEAFSSQFYEALPVPEPSTAVLSLIGLMIIGARKPLANYLRRA